VIARDDDRPLRCGELVVLHVTAHAEDRAERILSARLDPEEESRDLRDAGPHEMLRQLRSARDTEPMVARLTEATALTEQASIFVPVTSMGNSRERAARQPFTGKEEGGRCDRGSEGPRIGGRRRLGFVEGVRSTSAHRSR